MRKIVLLIISLILMMLLLLTVGTACLASTEKVVLRPQGYQLTYDAYVVPIADGRDTIEMIETQAAEITTLRGYAASQDATIDLIAADIAALEAAQKMERDAWQKSVDSLQKSNKKYKFPWSAGIFAGYDAVHQQVCVGVGVVYSFWRF